MHQALRSSSHAKEAEQSKLHAQLTGLRNSADAKLQAKDAELSQLQRELERSLSKIAVLEQAGAADQSDVHQLRGELEARQKAEARQTMRAESLEDDLEAAYKEAAALRHAATTHGDDGKLLRDALDRKTEQHRELQRELEKSQSKIALLEQDLRDLANEREGRASKDLIQINHELQV